MNEVSILIREMKDSEQQAVSKVGRRAFPFFEALFVGKPKRAIVAEMNGKIVGGIIYKYCNSNGKKIAYIDEAFVDPEVHGRGVGKQLYAETFRFLWDQGADGITALVKDDNVASWKLFLDNGFKRVSHAEIIRQLGAAGFLQQCLHTPFLFAVGMDFYMTMKEVPVKEKRSCFPQLAAFLLTNLLLLFPLWIHFFQKSAGGWLVSAGAYLTVLLLLLGTRYFGTLFSKERWKFRFNNGGCLITLLLSIWGNTFPMNANWYPEHYRNNSVFRRNLAIPEMIKWAVFLLLPWLAFTPDLYLRAIAQISCYYLVYMMIPLYPFEAMGAGRIYRFNKKLWLVGAAITAAELGIVMTFAL